VIGSTGSGKTTFARALAQRLGIPHIELDALFWQPNWTMTAPDEFKQRVAAALGAGEWVVDGNYNSRLGLACYSVVRLRSQRDVDRYLADIA
jgi:adenylate kinase family enzyme